MSIAEKTRQALTALFPAQDDVVDSGALAPEDQEEAEEQKEQPRQPGVIDQNYEERGFHLDALIEPEHLVQATQIMFELGYFIESITGVDWIKEEQLEAVYDFCRYDFDLCRVVIRVRIPRNDPHLPTITGIYTGANWHEREAHDFFGIVFDGHPHLIPLLLPEDADFHPLLKDFKA